MKKRTIIFPITLAVVGLMACTPSSPSIDHETRSNAAQKALSLKELKEAQDICAEFPDMKVCKDFTMRTFFLKVIDDEQKKKVSAGTVSLSYLMLQGVQDQQAKTIASMAAACEGYKKEDKKHLPHWCLTPTADPAAPAPTPEQ